MSERPFTSRDATISLYWALRGASDILIPRFTPIDWWECDLWRLTKSGFVDEYEIKLSLADFRADAGKNKGERFEKQPDGKWGYTPDSGRNKHQLLAESTAGPNRFWFAMPKVLAEKVEIPHWAGLMRIGPGGAYVVKQAPKRHRAKWNGKREKIMDTFQHRFWHHEAGKTTDIEPLSEADLGDEPTV